MTATQVDPLVGVKRDKRLGRSHERWIQVAWIDVQLMWPGRQPKLDPWLRFRIAAWFMLGGGLLLEWISINYDYHHLKHLFMILLIIKILYYDNLIMIITMTFS